MPDLDLVRRDFAYELDVLLKDSPLSTARITAVARQHGIGYSTLRSWCTGVHLPRTPEDNSEFGAFLFAVAADREHAERVFTLAKRAGRFAAHAKRRGPSTEISHLAAPVDVDIACRRVGHSARQLLSWLGTSRCRDLTAQAAAAMTGWPDRVAAQALAELVSTRLIVCREGQRYAVPDGVRTVINSSLALDDHAVRPAQVRLASFYGRATLAAARRLFPDLLELAPLPGAPPVRFSTDESASAWLLTERDNLVAAAEGILGHDQALTESLTDALRAAQQVRPHTVDWTPLAEAARRGAADDGISAARMAFAAGLAWWGRGDPVTAARLFSSAAQRWADPQRPREQAAALHMLGAVELAIGDRHNAMRHCAEALGIRRQTGKRSAQASTLVFLADAYLGLNQPEAAAHHANAVADLAERTGYSAAAAGALGSLGHALLVQGLDQDAERQFVHQQALSEDLAFHSRTAIALVGRALVRTHCGYFDTAIDLADEAVSAAVIAGNSTAEVDAYNAAAVAHRSRGRLAQAEAFHRKALHIADRVSYRHGRSAALAGLTRLRAPGS